MRPIHSQTEPQTHLKGIAMSEQSYLLEVKDLKTHFFLDRGIVRAVDGVSFGIEPGHTLGVLGESGCGKSVTGYSILRLVQKPGRIVDGQVLLRRGLHHGNGGVDEVIDLATLDQYGPEIRRIRGRDIAMVFQEPMTFLNPVYTLGAQIMEGILLHQVSKAEARAPKPRRCCAWWACRSGRHAGSLSAPALGGHAPAGHHRHGSLLPSEPADRR